jgi:hypothetical protein
VYPPKMMFLDRKNVVLLLSIEIINFFDALYNAIINIMMCLFKSLRPVLLRAFVGLISCSGAGGRRR